MGQWEVREDRKGSLLMLMLGESLRSGMYLCSRDSLDL
jgi:hypothetical protein